MTSVDVAALPVPEILLRLDSSPAGSSADAEPVASRFVRAGQPVVAVATKTLPPDRDRIDRSDESDLQLSGFPAFVDEPRASGGPSLARLKKLGITVTVATGDNPWVAEKVCAELGLMSGGSVTGADLAALDDDQFADIIRRATIFARVSPDQKARLVRTLRTHGRAVAFLGDGVNDALA